MQKIPIPHITKPRLRTEREEKQDKDTNWRRNDNKKSSKGSNIPFQPYLQCDQYRVREKQFHYPKPVRRSQEAKKGKKIINPTKSASKGY